jgi:hypothetical protein
VLREDKVLKELKEPQGLKEPQVLREDKVLKELKEPQGLKVP